FKRTIRSSKIPVPILRLKSTKSIYPKVGYCSFCPCSQLLKLSSRFPLLGLVVHHRFGSRYLIDLLNKMGMSFDLPCYRTGLNSEHNPCWSQDSHDCGQDMLQCSPTNPDGKANVHQPGPTSQMTLSTSGSSRSFN
ncbi:hypothetical protein MAR_031380, partial [Mya arenaria]